MFQTIHQIAHVAWQLPPLRIRPSKRPIGKIVVGVVVGAALVLVGVLSLV